MYVLKMAKIGNFVRKTTSIETLVQKNAQRSLNITDSVDILYFLQLTMSPVERSVAVVLLVLVSMVIHSSSTTTNDLRNNRCYYKSPWPKCGTCCYKALNACRKYCKAIVGCPWQLGCNVNKSNKAYMRFFNAKGCKKVCGMVQAGIDGYNGRALLNLIP